MTISLVITGIIFHFLFDWVLQSRDVARRKTEDLDALVYHGMIIYIGTFLFFVLVAAHVGLIVAIAAFVYSVIHAIQDKYIWTMYKKRYDFYAIDPMQDSIFFDTMAVDQVLHLILLFVLASLV